MMQLPNPELFSDWKIWAGHLLQELQNYDASMQVAFQRWEPSFTFSTPGDLSVSYSIRRGVYMKIGTQVWANFALTFTPTYGTASGDARVILPFQVNAAEDAYGLVAHSTGITVPAGSTVPMIQAIASEAHGLLRGHGPGVNTIYSTTQFPTATARSLRGSVFYEAAG